MNQSRHHPVAGVEKLERLRTEVVNALLNFGDQPLHSLDAVKDLLSWVFGGAVPFDIGCVEGRVGFPSPSEVLVAPSNQIKVLLRHRQLSISRRPLLPRPQSSLAPSRRSPGTSPAQYPSMDRCFPCGPLAAGGSGLDRRSGVDQAGAEEARIIWLSQLSVGVARRALELALDGAGGAADHTARDHHRRYARDVRGGHRGPLIAARIAEVCEPGADEGELEDGRPPAEGRIVVAAGAEQREAAARGDQVEPGAGARVAREAGVLGGTADADNVRRACWIRHRLAVLVPGRRDDEGPP